MTEHITARQFHADPSLAEWRVIGDGACTLFRTRSFAESARLIQAISELPDLENHTPDVDLRQDGVTVRLITITGNYYGISQRDVELARQISAAARDLDAPADPSAVQEVQLTIDALVSADVMPFWRAVLDYEPWGDEDVVDRLRIGPPIWFQPMDAPRPQRNRIHVDIFVPQDQAEARVAAAVAAGGRILFDKHAPQGWTLADPEGNEVDIATMFGRD